MNFRELQTPPKELDGEECSTVRYRFRRLTEADEFSGSSSSEHTGTSEVSANASSVMPCGRSIED